MSEVKHVRFVWPGAFHREVKVAAAERGVSMAMFVEVALRAAMGEHLVGRFGAPKVEGGYTRKRVPDQFDPQLQANAVLAREEPEPRTFRSLSKAEQAGKKK